MCGPNCSLAQKKWRGKEKRKRKNWKRRNGEEEEHCEFLILNFELSHLGREVEKRRAASAKQISVAKVWRER
jgi:hypothetical protein